MSISRPRRSALYMPGSNARALEKAKSLPADCLILDLEDSVAPAAKEMARDQLCAAVKAGGYGGREVVIRVNAFGTPWAEADIAAASRAGADALLLPKVETAEALQRLAVLMEQAGAPPATRIWAMLETPRGVLRAEAIADAHPRLAALVMGTSDLVKDLRARHSPMRLPVLASLSLCLLAARAAGLAILDGVYLDLEDEAGYAAACRQGVELGFDGKTVIHPKQIAAANEAFAPSAAALDQAERLIAAHHEALAAGQGVTVLDGKLVENLHVEEARRLIALAAAIRALA